MQTGWCFGKNSLGTFFGRVTGAEKWLRRITGTSVSLVGVYITLQQIYITLQQIYLV